MLQGFVTRFCKAFFKIGISKVFTRGAFEVRFVKLSSIGMNNQTEGRAKSKSLFIGKDNRNNKVTLVDNGYILQLQGMTLLFDLDLLEDTLASSTISFQL